MKQSGNAIGGIMDKPVLNGGYTVTQNIRVSRLLACILREMSNAERYQFAALCSVQVSIRIEKPIHICAPQLCDAFFLRHTFV